MSTLPHHVIESFVHIRIVNSTTIAAVTVLTWDYLLTLPDEVALVWPSSWTLSKCLFLLNRYFAFIDPIMLIYVLMVEDDVEACVSKFHTLAYICVLGFIVGQCILILRAYAVWGTHFNNLFAVMFCIILCTFGLAVWAESKYLGGVFSTGVPAKGMRGCTLFFKNRLLWIDLVLVTVVEFTSTGLLVIKAIQHFRITRSSLMTTIYHDGVLYFACVLATTVANLIVVLSASADINNFLIVVQRVLHSVLCSRVLLHIRSAYKAQQRHLTGDSLPPIVISQITEPSSDSLWPSDHSEFHNGRRNHSPN
ncbi:hypothetical protein BD410DRAFT_630709 [Rickenella mellea]|uniref:DUF6533 domain-containing protein n=1 Tax=Rickenella mellea TaxID=50990 RepID=A0A4Y7QCR3_9AGAM|nr:hypothetical protein BD410DRAFT_630709 [Rickenella mellea]